VRNSTAMGLIVALLVTTPAFALDDDWCGFDPQESRAFYDYGDSIRAKFIFVDFPDGPNWDFSVMEEGLHKAVVDTIKWWLASHTQQQFVFTGDTGIVFKPDDDFQGDGTAAPWLADLEPEQYAHSDSLMSPGEREWYLCRWKGGGECDPGNLVADIHDWWLSETITYRQLMAEILYKIYAAYQSEPASEWPFGDYNQYGGEDDAVDALFFVFMARGSVYADHGGTPGIPINVQSVFDFDGGNGERFFGSIAKSGDLDRFHGTGQVHNSVNGDDGQVFKIGNCAFVILHEFSHTFGWLDGPPPLQSTGTGAIWRYYFGGLNITSQHYVPGRGLPVASLHNLADLADPWVPVIDFTGQNHRDVKLYDLRHREDADSLGTIYKFRMENQNADPQWFLFAYHAGYGVDAQSDPVEGDLVPSRGLEVQHVVGGDGNVVDIESAFGLYRDITVDTLPPLDIPPEFLAWANPDSVRGFDNYDLWWVGNDSTSLRSIDDDYGHMNSQRYDFFTADTLWSATNDPWTKPEFSYRTNPSCSWYADDWHDGLSYRFNRQILGNSLFVRIKDQHDEEGPNDAPYMIVDFLSAPEEVVLTPDATGGSVIYAPDDQVLVSWTNEFGAAVTSVDVVLSKAGDGWVDPDTLVSGFAVGEQDTTWTWLVGEDDGTDQGKLKVVFHNPYSHHVGESKSPGFFSVAAFVEVVEAIVAPEGGESLYANSPFRVEWTDYFGSGLDSTIAQTDMSLTLDDGESWIMVAEGLTPEYDQATEYNYTMFTPADSMVTVAAKLRLTFTSEGGNVASDTTGAFAIYPLGGVFVDVSNAASVDYEGLPYSIVTLDFSEGTTPDIFVSIQACEDCSDPTSKLYDNQSEIEGAIEFYDATAVEFPAGSRPNIESLGVAVADYDDDGDDDFFLAHESAPQFFRYANGEFSDVAANTTVFPAAVQDSLAKSYHASWVDYDHDGDVDLYVGRAVPENPKRTEEDAIGPLAPWPDALFENAGGAFTEVGRASGLVGDVHGATLTSVWADLDDDDKWELAVGDYHTQAPETKLFEEVVTRKYAVNGRAFPPGFSSTSVVGLQALDYDRDGDLDLVAVSVDSNSYVLVNASTDTLTTFDEAIELPGPSGRTSAGCTVVDYDLDGLPDILLPNGEDTTEPQLWANLHGRAELPDEFVDIAGAANLTDGRGGAQGALAADLNGDGDLDLALGRMADQGRVFKNTEPDSTDLPANHWLAFRPIPGNEDNGSAIGTTISLQDGSGTPLGTQIVDGGSGRGGQLPRMPIFGLGDLDENVDVSVRWPAGRSTDTTIAPVDFDGVIEIGHASTLNIDDASVTFIGEMVPGTDTVDWIFVWETDYWSDAEMDAVDVEHIAGETCFGLSYVPLQYGDPGVSCSVTYQVDPTTGDITFRHELRWTPGNCLIGCTYRYRVHSDNGVSSDQSPATGWKSISFKVCPSN